MMKKESPVVTGSLIAASAGTGKTYQLAGRYIALLALGADPESLIAMTFTNKAAGEFRGRIFKTLAEGALDKKNAQGRNELAARIMEVLSAKTLNVDGETWSLGDSKLSVPLVPETAEVMEEAVRCKVYPEKLMANHPLIGKELNAEFFRKILKKLVSQISRLKLYTFDSFFQSTVNRNKMLLGLSNVTPLTGADEESAQNEALNALLKEADSTAEKRAAFRFLRSETSPDGGNLRDDLKNAVKTYRTLFALYGADRWGDLAKFGLETGIAQAEPWTKEQRKAALAELAHFVESHRDMSEADKKKIKAAQSSIEKIIVNLNFDGLDKHTDPINKRAGSNINKLLERPTDTPAAHEYVTLVKDYIERAGTEMQRATYAKTVGMYQLMKAYDDAYQKSVVNTGRMSFGEIKKDAARLLKGDLDDGTLAFHETGILSHWMLDEFQDTSPAEWGALYPLLTEVAQEDHIDKAYGDKIFPVAEKSLFVVGDEKQSIYAWRDATPELFGMLKGAGQTPKEKEEGVRFSKALNQTSLDYTFRSSAVITDFVNILFKQMGCSDAYTRHKSGALMKYLKEPLSGYVDVRKLKGETIAENKQNAFLTIRDIIAGLKEEAPSTKLKHGMSVAVLVRTNDDGEEIVDYLQKSGLGVEVQLVADRPLVEASPVSEVLLNFFRWLQHPSDSYTSGLIALAHLGSNGKKTCTEENQSPTLSVSYWQQRLEEEGYLAVVDALMALLPYRDATIPTWQRLAMSFDEDGGSLDDWIHKVSAAAEKSIPAKGIVQVMTMHKSKGLEFDAVILPFLSSKSVTDTRYLTHLVAPQKDAILLAPDAKARQYVPAFAAAEERWKTAQKKEAQNLMYVAITRAKHAQYILLGKGNSDSTSDMIEKALEKMHIAEEEPVQQDATPDNGETLPYLPLYLHPGSNPDWAQQLADEAAAAQETDQEKTKEPVPQTAEEVKGLGAADPALRKTHPSETETELTYSDEEKPEGYERRGNAAEFGTAVHALFEQVEWLDKTAHPHWLTSPQTEAERVAAQALSIPEIRRFFLSAEFPNTEVLNEQMLEKIENNTWTTAIIDRLMLLPNGKALILDFKTDWARKGLEERHRHQMEQYRCLVHEATDIALSDISVCLLAVGCATPCAVPIDFAV